MKPRSALALAVAVVGLLIGAIIVGRPISVPNDIVLDPNVVTTTTPSVVTDPPSTDSSADTAIDDASATESSIAASSELDARVVVVNASALAGVATSNAALLTAAGFTDVVVADAPVQALSVVYVRPGFEASGLRVAEEFALPIDVVLSLPSVPVTALDAEADVLVVIGADWAGER